jgi:hypothetical protein
MGLRKDGTKRRDWWRIPLRLIQTPLRRSPFMDICHMACCTTYVVCPCPLHAALSQPPTYSTWHYPTPTNSPLPESNAPRTSFTETEPPPLVFGFLTQNTPPWHATLLQPPTLARQSIPTSQPLYPSLTRLK